MKSQPSGKRPLRRGSNHASSPPPQTDAPLAPDQAAKVGRVREALDRGEYAMDRAVDITVDRVMADLYGE
ncbi:MAG: hypothetical protein ACE5E5_01580 [Phycisphaerae bacterium]